MSKKCRQGYTLCYICTYIKNSCKYLCHRTVPQLTCMIHSPSRCLRLNLYPLYHQPWNISIVYHKPYIVSLLISLRKKNRYVIILRDQPFIFIKCFSKLSPKFPRQYTVIPLLSDISPNPLSFARYILFFPQSSVKVYLELVDLAADGSNHARDFVAGHKRELGDAFQRTYKYEHINSLASDLILLRLLVSEELRPNGRCGRFHRRLQIHPQTCGDESI